MFDRIKIWAMSNLWYWRARAIVKGLQFRLEAFSHGRRNALTSARTGTRVFATLLWLGIKSAAWASLALAALYFIETFIRARTDWLQPITGEDRTFYIDQLRMYAQLLTAVFSIYFATVGIILSSGYTRLRRDIIQLLTSEQVGGVYVNVVVYSAVFCVMGSILGVFGYDLGTLVIVTGTMLVLISSVSLFPLGQRLFNFFDLNSLAKTTILPRISRHITSAANPKNSISLANHHSVCVRNLLDQLDYINRQTLAQPGRLSETLPGLSSVYSSILVRYAPRKHEIDQQSYWFPRKPQHQKWFYAGDTATNVAIKSRSQLSIKEEPNLFWIEERISKVLSEHLNVALRAGQFDLALTLLYQFQRRLLVYANELQLDLGLTEIEQIQSILESTLKSDLDLTEAQELKLQVFCDAWLTFGSNLCLETLRRMITFETDLGRFFERDVWTVSSIQKLPAFLQSDITFIALQVQFELSTEGSRLSRPKYNQQLAAGKILRKYGTIVQLILDFHVNAIPKLATSLKEAKKPAAATQILLASLHAYWKLPRWFDNLSDLFARYYELEKYTAPPLKLQRIEMGNAASDLVQASDKAVKMLSEPELLFHVGQTNLDENSPDHFGQVYFELAEECVAALHDNNADKFNALFPAFLSLALMASEHRFRDPGLDINSEFRMHLVSTVYQDLATVLGYSILASELYDNKTLSEAALKRFDDVTNKLDDTQLLQSRMLQFSDPSVFSWSTSPRSQLRMNWKMAFEQRLRNDGLSRYSTSRRRKDHQSRVINEFLNSYLEASHFFFAIHLLHEIGELDFEVDRRIQRLAAKLSSKHPGDA